VKQSNWNRQRRILAGSCAILSALSAKQAATHSLFIRNAWLKGLSPAENREVPPLQENGSPPEKSFQISRFASMAVLTPREEVECALFEALTA
jgi:hypothetical protein